MHSVVYESIWVKLGITKDAIELYVDTNLCDLDLDSRSQKSKKANTLGELTHKVFNQLKWNVVCFWDLLM